MTARIALSTNEFADDAAKCFEVCRKHGIKFMEVWLNPWAPGCWDAKTITSAARDWAKAGVQVACISSWSQLNRSPETQASVLESIEVASAVGAKFVNSYYGINEELSDEQGVAAYVKTLAPCLELAAKHGITVCVENEFDCEPSASGRHEFTGRAYNCLKLFEAVKADNFGLNYDACNFHIAGEEGFPLAYEVLKKHIKYVHLKNACKQDDALYGPKAKGHHASGDFTYVPATQGALNAPGMLDRLHKDTYSGFVTMEPHDTRDLMGNIEKTVAFLRSHPLFR